MVTLSAAVSTDPHPVENTMVDLAKSLMDKKTGIEKEMDEIANTLRSESFGEVGLKNPLVDPDGFPLSGIDIHQVRAYRNRFAILTNDLAQIVDEIEAAIHQIHEHARSTGSVSAGTRTTLHPFGRVESVMPSSAAEDCGILPGDKIVKFGPLSCLNPSAVSSCYEAIPSTVKNLSASGSFDVQIIRPGRESEEIIVQISPKDGRIGCLIKPI